MPHTALRFVIPSLLGVLIFLTPIPWDGHLTIGIGIITSWVRRLLGDYGLHLVVLLTVVTSVMTLVATYIRPAWTQNNAELRNLFNVPPVWVLLRLTGMVFALVYFFQIGPALLRSEDVGGAVFVGIAVNVVAVYISACLLLPLLTDYGLMEFAGTLAGPAFRRAFNLPGRAAVDAVASFVGASAIAATTPAEKRALSPPTFRLSRFRSASWSRRSPVSNTCSCRGMAASSSRACSRR